MCSEPKQAWPTPVQETAAGLDVRHLREDVTRPTSRAETSVIETQRDEESGDSVKRRHVWEDALDEAFAEEQGNVWA